MFLLFHVSSSFLNRLFQHFLKDEVLEMFIHFDHLCFWVPSFRIPNITFLEMPVDTFASAQL